MTPSAENLKLREKFLTPELYKQLESTHEVRNDYFTASEEPPKTFKIGKCESSRSSQVALQVQIYWRDDAKVTQKEVQVEAVKIGDEWLVNSITQ